MEPGLETSRFLHLRRPKYPSDHPFPIALLGPSRATASVVVGPVAVVAAVGYAVVVVGAGFAAAAADGGVVVGFAAGAVVVVAGFAEFVAVAADVVAAIAAGQRQEMQFSDWKIILEKMQQIISIIILTMISFDKLT